MTVAAGIHAHVRADKAARNRRAQDAPVDGFGDRLPGLRRVGDVKAVGLAVRFDLEIDVPGVDGLDRKSVV